jgi:hypothetical protein
MARTRAGIRKVIRRISSSSRSSLVVPVTRATAQLFERQVGHDARSARTALTVEDHEIHVAKHALHRFEVETAAGHFGRLFVFLRTARKRLASPWASLTTWAR